MPVPSLCLARRLLGALCFVQAFWWSEAILLNRLAHWVVEGDPRMPVASGTLHEGGAKIQGKLFFLFLARDSLPNEQIWMNFFAFGKQGVDYETLVHCTNESACRKTLGSRHSAFTLIPTTSSAWCTDLVSPMNALLKVAMKSEGGTPHDKFVFLSESTVPIKSFQHVQHQLLVEDGIGSSFCIHPWSAWAWHEGTDVAVKHDQWIVLNREHAQHSLEFADQAPLTFLRTLTPLVWSPSELTLGKVEWLARGMYLLSHDFTLRLLGSIYFSVLHLAAWIGPPYVGGCADEFWHFAAAFDFVDRRAGASGLAISGLSGSPQLVMNELTYHNTTQGRCHTYTHFRPDADHFAAFTAVLHGTPGTKLATAHDGKHPTRFEQLSEQSMAAFQQSPFLFVRKVDDHTSFNGPFKLSEAFDHYIFQPNGSM